MVSSWSLFGLVVEGGFVIDDGLVAEGGRVVVRSGRVAEGGFVVGGTTRRELDGPATGTRAFIGERAARGIPVECEGREGVGALLRDETAGFTMFWACVDYIQHWEWVWA